MPLSPSQHAAALGRMPRKKRDKYRSPEKTERNRKAGLIASAEQLEKAGRIPVGLADQLREEYFPGSVVRSAQRRLAKELGHSSD